MGLFDALTGLGKLGADEGNAFNENQSFQLAKQKILSDVADTQSQTGLRQAETRNLTNTIPVTIPNGDGTFQTINAPIGVAGKILSPAYNYFGKARGQDIRQKTALLAMGMRLNDDTGEVEKIPDEELPPGLKSKLALNDTLDKLREAQTQLAQAKNDPNSPLFKQAQQKVNILGQLASQKFGELALGGAKLNAEYAFHGMNNDGTPKQQPGSVSPESFAMLSPHAQQIIMETAPVKRQVQDLIQRIDDLGLAKDNTPGKLLFARLQYSMGIASPEGSLGEDISKLELARVVGAARILRGSSRAFAALEQAMQHLPNAWRGSPMLMRQQLQTVLDNLTDVENDAAKYGNKFGITPLPNLGNVPKVLDAATAQQFMKQAGGDPAKARALAKTAGYSKF